MPLFDVYCKPCDFTLKDKLLSHDTNDDPKCPYCKGRMNRLPSVPAAFIMKESPQIKFKVDTVMGAKDCTVETKLREFNEKTWEAGKDWQG